VKVLDLSKIQFTNTDAVKAECLRYWEGTKSEFWDDSYFEKWWKSKTWLAFQKGEKEVLVLNKLKFKSTAANRGFQANPKSAYGRGFTKRSKYNTYESWVTRK